MGKKTARTSCPYLFYFHIWNLVASKNEFYITQLKCLRKFVARPKFSRPKHTSPASTVCDVHIVNVKISRCKKEFELYGDWIELPDFVLHVCSASSSFHKVFRWLGEGKKYKGLYWLHTPQRSKYFSTHVQRIPHTPIGYDQW